MANCICFTPVCSFASPNKPGLFIGKSVAGQVFRVKEVFPSSKVSKFQSLEVKATDDNTQRPKINSLVCKDCEGNGSLHRKYSTACSDHQFSPSHCWSCGNCSRAIACTQCKGDGVNSVDHFNGQFKAGGLCWLCRGKKDILCGSCNGAGFMGGFMSTADT